jgi:metal-sulfur cluster biosynthetic enzyme
MRDDVPCELPAGYDGSAILERLAQVLDPELDEPILDLGFVRSLELRSGHACVALRLPTSWCAVNFAYLMAEDVRRALLGVEGIRQATVRLGDHCAAEEIEAAVNDGRPLPRPFPARAPGAWRRFVSRFCAKGFSAARSGYCERCATRAARRRRSALCGSARCRRGTTGL